MAALARATHGNLFAAQKQSMCYPDDQTAVCGKYEITERIKWMIQGFYLIFRHEGLRVATKTPGARGRPCSPGAVTVS